MPVKTLVAALTFAAAAIAAENQVTFHKDVEPILQKHCQTCHRPGQAAPMSFLTYREARPWAKAMKTAVALRKMPPWFADPQAGHFLNDRSLKAAEIETIAKWADGGAAEGNSKEAPAAVAWPEGWQIQPDIIVPGPTFNVPAGNKNNVVEWVSVTVPSGFTKDTWITSVQIKPEYPAVTHHMCLGFNPHTPDVKYFDPVWQNKARDEEGAAIPGKGPTFGPASPGGRFRSMAEDCYLPGNPAADYRIFDAAKLVPAGSDITLNLHYTPNGAPVTDHVQIGFTVAKEPPRRRYVSMIGSSPQDPEHFAIPPNEGNWQSPPVEVTFNQDVELVFMMPHMHVRGKDMTYTLVYPDGKKEVVLNVPHYDFNWQLGYNTSLKVPKGTKLRVDAHFDNSVNNKFNPNPNRTVYYGEMTWEEMMNPFFGVVVEGDVDPNKILAPRGSVPNGA
ncbi:MAG: thiol-disulfide isomerase [Terriglobia bacterium]|nr:MAG: thiol-disulfide isomerase [Terriglobia bacterium]